MSNKNKNPFHHLKNAFFYDAISKKYNINKFSYLPKIYHSNIMNNEIINLRYYNAYDFEDSGHAFYRNEISNDYNDAEFSKKLECKKIDDENINDNDDISDLLLANI